MQTQDEIKALFTKFLTHYNATNEANEKVISDLKTHLFKGTFEDERTENAITKHLGLGLAEIRERKKDQRRWVTTQYDALRKEWESRQNETGKSANSQTLPQVQSNSGAVPKVSTQNTPPGISEQMAYLSPRDISNTYGVPFEALKKRLERFRKNNQTGWQEVANRGANDPQFLFQVSAIKAEIEALNKES